MKKLVPSLLAGAILAAATPAVMAANQGSNPTAMPEAQRLISAALGLTSTTDTDTQKTTTIVYLRPDLNLGSLSVGLDLSLGITDGSPELTKSFRDSIRYVSLGREGISPLYIRAGNLDATTMGTGILVDNYSNLTLDENARGAKDLGLVLKLDTSVVGLESVSAKAPFFNDEKHGLKASRAYIKPLPFIQVGVSTAKDDSPELELAAPLTAVAVDAEFHIGKNLLVPYVSAARFTDKGDGAQSGDGYTAGLRGGFDLGGLKLGYKGELRLSASDFVPGLWDFAYETEKHDGTVLDQLNVVGDSTIGVMGQAVLSVPPLGLTVLGQMESAQPYENDLAQVLDLAPKVVAEASLSDKIAIPVAGGKVSLGARYEAVLSRDSDDLGKLKTLVTWRSPIGLTLSFISQTEYAKDKSSTRSFSVEGGMSF